MAASQVATANKRSSSEDKDARRAAKKQRVQNDPPSTTTTTAEAEAEAGFLTAATALDPILTSLFTSSAPQATHSEQDPHVHIVSRKRQPSPHDAAQPATPQLDQTSRRKRKRKDLNEDLEQDYLGRLARVEQKTTEKLLQSRPVVPHAEQDLVRSDDDDDTLPQDMDSPPPMHESLQPEISDDMLKAQRTVFISNVSIQAIKSKSARKELLSHMSSFFAPSAPGQPSPTIESVRFRSTAYAAKIPKKAAFAKKELMDATTVSTNAYLVYSAQHLAREAARKLNGSVVLDRHIHVDEIAHPAKIDHHRCIFVGNLGFVDDESLIDKANAEQGREQRRGRKIPSDVEEGLWRTFARCGAVENVRMVRDSKTRVGKGIAYVQFADENAVEAALQYHDKKFPPMLPRKLRVMRAKAVKRNARPNPDSTRSGTNISNKAKTGRYVPKMTPQQHSNLGRANRLLGHHAAARMQSSSRSAGSTSSTSGGKQQVRAPESFVFEGHRASSVRPKGDKKGKPTNRSTKRATAWRESGGQKK